MSALRRLCISLLFGPTLAIAGGPASLDGAYRASGGDRADAIERLVAEMPWWQRQIARRRLHHNTAPCGEVEISTVADDLTIRCDDRAPATAPPGETVVYRDEQGRPIDLTFQIADDQIVQTFATPEGKRVNVYSVAGDTLTIAVTVTSRRLPRPLEYAETYSRRPIRSS